MLNHNLSYSRLVGGTRLIWGDRGQPETFYKPVNGLVRMYRVKEL